MDDIRLDGFEIIEKLGEGGGAPVLKARQVSLDRIVAIKVLTSRTARERGDMDRLQLEAQAAAKLKHPGIVQVYDARWESDLYYIVMEYVAGYTVGDWIRRKGAIGERDVLLVSENVAAALNHAWQKARIVHCDIKPDNVFIDADGTVKVGDLGLARIAVLGGGGGVQDEVMGTPAYISPEQASGAADLDLRSDIYSLGATMYHMAVGRTLFADRADGEIMENQVHGQDADPMDLNPKLSPALSWLLERMLAKDRAHRQDSWDEVLADIADVKRGVPPRQRLGPRVASTLRRSARRAGGAGAPASSGRMKRVASDAGGKPNILALAIVGGLVLALAAAAIVAAALKARSPAADAPPRVPPPPPPVAEAPARITPEEDAARRQFEELQQWVQANPDAFDEAMRRLMVFAGTSAGTEFARLAESEMGRLKADRLRRRNAILSDLERQAEALGAGNRWVEAAALCEGYAGPLAEETREHRLRRAAEFRGRHQYREDEQKLAAQALDGRVESLLDRVVNRLVESGVDAAAAELQAGSRELLSTAKAPIVAEVQSVFAKARDMDGRVMASFSEQLGQKASVQLTTGPRSLVVDRVESGVVQGHEDVARGGATVRLPVTFGIKDLAVRERLIRMGSDDQPEVSLVKGLMALQSGALPHARKYFAMTLPVLRSRLAAAADAAEKRGASPGDDAARRDLGLLLKAAGIEAGPYDADGWRRAVEAWSAAAADPAHVSATVPVEEFRRKHAASAFLAEAEPLLALIEKRAGAAAPVAGPGDDAEPPRRRRRGGGSRGPRDGVKADEAGRDHPARMAVVSKLLRRNPTLVDEDIRMDLDKEGSPVRLAVISPGLTDLSPVAELASLRALYCGSVPPHNLGAVEPRSLLRDLACLKPLALESLDLALTAVADLSALREMPLIELNIRHTPVSDLAPLKDMPLERLNIRGSRVRNLAPLRGMGLAWLDAGAVAAFDFDALRGMPLEHLDLGQTQVRDIAALRDMPLRQLDLENTRVYDFAALRGLPLEVLNLAGTQFRDASVLKGMRLTTLNLRGTKVADLSALAGMPLVHLTLDDVPAGEFAALAGMPLRHLSLAGCRIHDLSLLAGTALVWLNLKGTRVRSIAALEGMKDLNWLSLADTDVADLSPTRSMALEYLDLRGSRARDLSALSRQPICSLWLDNAEIVPPHILRSMPRLQWVNGVAWRRW